MAPAELASPARRGFVIGLLLLALAAGVAAVVGVVDGAPHGFNVSHAEEFSYTLLDFLEH